MMQFWPCYCFHIWICFQSVVYLIFASGIALMFVNCDASSPKLPRSWCQHPCRVDTAVADTSAIANLSNKLLFSSRKDLFHNSIIGFFSGYPLFFNLFTFFVTFIYHLSLWFPFSCYFLLTYFFLFLLPSFFKF